MLRYILSRCVSLVISLAVSSLVIFIAIEIIPGDPATFMLGINAQPDNVLALKEQLGLTGNPIERYFRWILGMIVGDFGTSYTYKVSVSELISDRVWVSLPLAVFALTIAVFIALPVGLISVINRGKTIDWTMMAVSQFGIAVPNFWFAMMLVLFFSIYLGWFSAGGMPGWENGIFLNIKALTLPAVALALPQAAILSRVLRSALLETLSQDYIRTARAKGLSNNETIIRHGFRNAMIPVLTIMGLQFSFLSAGAIIIENVFFLPGLGRLVFQGIIQRDLIVVESVVMLLVFMVIIVTFLIDIAHFIIDPRLRKTG